MAVNLFASVDISKISKLPFLQNNFGEVVAYPFGYVSSNHDSRLGIVYEISSNNADKLKNLLVGKEDKQLVKGDRVFVLSGNKIPRFKIKEYIRKIGAVMVNEIEDATVMIGNSQIYKEHRDYEYNEIDSVSMLLNTVYITVSDIKLQDFKIDDILKDYYPDLDELGEARFNRACGSRGKSYGSGTGTRYMNCITPYVTRLAYEILSKKIITISEESLFKQLPASANLDKDMCESLITMMNSADEENRKTAHEILANCNYENADLYLYTIAKEHYYQISSSRYKNVKLFVKESKLYEFYIISEETYLKDLAKNNKLTKEALDLLLPIVTSKIESRVNKINSSIFNIKIELRPDFTEILGDHKFNKEVKLDENTEEDDV